MLKIVVHGGGLAEAMDEELLLIILPCFQNFSFDVAILVFLKGKLAFCKIATKALLKPHVS